MVSLGGVELRRSATVLLLTAALGAVADPYSTAEFTPGTTPTDVKLEGHLTIDASGLDVHEYNRVPFVTPIRGAIPRLEIDLVQSGQDLLPARRGLVTTSDPMFDYFVGPGRVWSDGERARASLPFTLATHDTNCAHNGLVTFVFTATSVDDVRVLVNQETCHFVKFDLWGSGKGTFTPGTIANAAEIRAQFADERKHLIPSDSLDAFAAKYHADNAKLLGGLPTNHDLTTAGVYIGGVRYAKPCSTRNGDYPFCDHMLLTSFSTAKSAFPAVVLMALAQQYGREVYEAKIADYVPEAKTAKGDWANVTFNQVGDMASGNFSNGAPMADDAPGNFYFDLDRAGKLHEALSFPNGAKAGTRFVYQTGDTYILVNALDRWLAVHDTGYTDSFAFLVDKVLKPLHVSPDAMWTRRTRDNGAVNSGTAFGGMGMWWTADALVKVARFMSIANGAIDGKQVLEPHALAATLQRDPADRGMATNFFGNYYNNGMWASPIGTLSCTPWVPFMTGLSGVRATLIPGDVIFYYFDDVQAFPLVEAVQEVDKIKPLCS